MSMILDLLIIAIAVITIIVAAKRGFVKSIAHIATSVLSFLAAYFWCGRLGDFIYDRFLLGSFSGYVEDSVNNLLVKTGETFNIAKLFEDMPDAFVSLLARFGIDVHGLAEKFGEITSGTSETISQMSESIASPIASATATAIAFAAIFLVSILVISLLFKLLDLACKLPVLKSANGFLGGVIGVVLAVFYIWVFSAIAVVALRSFSATDSSFIFSNAVENSVLLKFFVSVNPVASFLGIS